MKRFCNVFLTLCLAVFGLSSCEKGELSPSPQVSDTPTPVFTSTPAAVSHTPKETVMETPTETLILEPEEKSLGILVQIDEANQLPELLKTEGIETLSFVTKGYDANGNQIRSVTGQYSMSDNGFTYESLREEGGFRIEERGYTDPNIGYPACYGVLYGDNGRARRWSFPLWRCFQRKNMRT